jgi:hypothetical protein
MAVDDWDKALRESPDAGEIVSTGRLTQSSAVVRPDN